MRATTAQHIVERFARMTLDETLTKSGVEDLVIWGMMRPDHATHTAAFPALSG